MKENIIFGVGQRGRKYLCLLQGMGIRVDNFCDNNAAMWDKKVEDIPVISPQELKEKHYDANVLIANRFYTKEIGAQLDDMGIRYVESLEEMFFWAKRMNCLENVKQTVLVNPPDDPDVTFLIINEKMPTPISENTLTSIQGQAISIPYEVVLWEGEQTEVRGKKIVVVVNNSLIQIDAVCGLMEVERQTGAVVGSKTITRNGKIVQAGYIIQRECIVSYGYGEKAVEPEYEYIRECDASSVNGLFFDRDYLNIFLDCLAEYENLVEVAVAFSLKIRAEGEKIFFQPFSLIVEQEETNGELRIKSHKLLAWCQQYLDDRSTCSQDLFWQANRGKYYCHTLVADTSIAKFDTNAGNRSTYSYIQIFLELNMWIIYIIDNFQYDIYVKHFQKLGIFVVYGERWKERGRMILRDILPGIEYAFLNRPQIAIKYIDMIRTYSDAVVVHYGHDLHHIRLFREFNVTGNTSLLEEAAHYKEIELDLIQRVDVTGYPSIVEVNKLKELFPKERIELFPLYFFDDLPDEIEGNNKEGILFVGSFSHRPNVDAAIWLVEEILPELRKRGVSDTLYLVGAKPTERVLEMRRADVIVTGYVTDEELDKYYKHCFVDIIPLRFGAGMKGKILEAMYKGIPVVTTDIGIEGLEAVEDIIYIGNTVEQIVNRVVSLKKDKNRLRDIRNKERAYIVSNFGKESLKKMIQKQVELRH